MKNIYLLMGTMWILSCKTTNTEETKTNTAADSKEQTVTLDSAQLKRAALSMDYPVVKTLNEILQVTGVVDVPPQNMVSVSFPLGGYLKSTRLIPGSNVKKGETIAVMEDPVYVQIQQEFLSAKAKMEFLQVDVVRQKELSDQDAGTKKNYQQVLSEFKVQQITIKALEEKLRIVGINPDALSVATISRTINLKSPITGYVTKLNVNIGKYVNPSDVLFELVDPTDIHAALTVYEKDIAQIKKGMMATVTLADYPNKKHPVEVILITQNINDNRAGIVHCHFEDAHHDLLPGMFLNGSFKLPQTKAATINEDAILTFEGKKYVFVAVKENEFEMMPVETGITENGFTILKEQKGTDWTKQKLVTKNAHLLLGKLKNKGEEE
jgi:membrane fusion protein, heavy metal efflux system